MHVLRNKCLTKQQNDENRIKRRKNLFSLGRPVKQDGLIHSTEKDHWVFIKTTLSEVKN